MFERFFPDMIVEGFEDIDLELLKKNKIKGLILDIDNTIVPWNEMTGNYRAKDWINMLINEGFDVCLVSNSNKKRVEQFSMILGLRGIHNAVKPFKRGFLKACDIMNIKPEQAAVVGDQIFTDIYGGNRLKMFTILVKPISEKDFILTKFKRIFEKIVLSKK